MTNVIIALLLGGKPKGQNVRQLSHDDVRTLRRIARRVPNFHNEMMSLQRQFLEIVFDDNTGLWKSTTAREPLTGYVKDLTYCDFASGPLMGLHADVRVHTQPASGPHSGHGPIPNERERRLSVSNIESMRLVLAWLNHYLPNGPGRSEESQMRSAA